MRRSDEVAAEGSGSKHGRTDSRGQGAEKTGRGALSRGAGAVKHAASATVGGVKHVAGEAATHTAGAVMLENQSRERPGGHATSQRVPPTLGAGPAHRSRRDSEGEVAVWLWEFGRRHATQNTCNSGNYAVT